MMSKISNCPRCSFNITTEQTIHYCPDCLSQIRCKNCDSEIMPNAKGCVSCGVALSNSNIATNAVNKIEYEQKGDSKKFSATFTDEIGQNLVESLGGLFNGVNPKLNASKTPSSSFFTTNKGLNDAVKKDNNFNNSIEDAEIIEDRDEKNKDAINQIFKLEDDRLILVNQRLKHKSDFDYSVRVTLLLIYGYSFIPKKQVERTLIYEAIGAKKNTTYFRKWLAQSDELVRVAKDMFELSKPGEEAVQNILGEFLDSSVVKGSIEFYKLKQKNSAGRKEKNGKGKISKVEEPSVDSPKTTKNTTNKKSPGGSAFGLHTIRELIQEGYFNSKRAIGDMSIYLKDKKAITAPSNRLASILTRLTKNKELDRVKNKTNNQYEYFKQ